jgi:peptide-methionine (S)-S-oxide reductase
MFAFLNKTSLPAPGQALPGRADAIATADTHYVTGRALKGPFPEGSESVLFGMGCFWGAERKFWQMGKDKIWLTAVGYAAGQTPNPTYEEVCSGMTGHNEVVLVVYDPRVTPFEELLKTFWENHDPTQGMRQGNDVGTQYRSGIYASTDAQREAAERSAKSFGLALADKGFAPITTEIRNAPHFYYAEAYHQQYLAKNPNGYCGLGGTGVTCAIGTGVSSS